MSSTKRLKLVLEHVKLTGNLAPFDYKTLSEDERELIRHLIKNGLVEESLRFIDEMGTDQEWNLVLEQLDAPKKRDTPLWKSTLRYAALFIGLLATVYFFQAEKKKKGNIQVPEEAITLKVGGGTLKIIHEGESQKITSPSGKIIGNQVGNMLSYLTNSEIEELVYNELEIPLGKIFNVELSDGTLVHLNSGTKIRYPIKFLKGRNREVFIEGEAYFKVAKDKDHPFIVNADAVSVRVLGTEFNITSYPEDKEIKTVLVEGSVNMSNSLSPDDSVVLKPGNKGSWNKAGYGTAIEEVDVSLYTSWITGDLIFRDTMFKDMLKKLERRYNVTIENKNHLLEAKLWNARFNVNIESIEDILKSINQIQKISYSVENRKVLIDY